MLMLDKRQQASCKIWVNIWILCWETPAKLNLNSVPYLNMFAVMSPRRQGYSSESDRTFQGYFDSRLLHTIFTVSWTVIGRRICEVSFD